MKRRLIGTLAIVGLLIAGCGSGTSDNYSKSEAPGGYVLFDSETGNIPYPNDILFAPSEGQPIDGTLNIPYKLDDKDADVKQALDTLDGFSTTSPISVGVSAEINSTTLQGNLHLYRVYATEINITSPIPIVGSIIREQTFGKDFVATYSDGKIVILPLKPLESNAHYMVALMKGVESTDGKPIEPDYVTSLLIDNTPLFDDQGDPAIVLDSDPNTNRALLTKLAGIQQLTQQMIAVANRDAGIDRANLLSIWSFTTQSIGKVAEAIVQNGTNDAYLGLRDTGYTSKDLLLAAGYDVNDTMYGIAQVYAGRLANLPYYLGIPVPEDPTAPLTKSFTFSSDPSMPEETGRVTIPVLAATPNAASRCKEPDAGWPVAIFQHGITRNRLDVLAISEAFAKICYAVVGIDLPLHGVFDPDNPLYDQYDPTTHTGERTFDLDFLTQDANETVIAKKPDGKPDTSGIHYINFNSLLTARDNIRQSTSDYVALYNALAAAKKEINGLSFDESKIAYVGHSLGTIAPFGYFSYQENAGQSFNEVLLSMPGGGITNIMLHSQTFGETVINGLKEAGLEPGSSAFNSFVIAMQTVLDDADPLNYASLAATKQKFLMHAVKNDDVIPNTIPSSPISGGLPIIRLMGATDITTYFETGETAKRIYPAAEEDIFTLFAKGNHRSLFIPDYNLLTTIEMQTEMDSFIASQGVVIDANLTRILQ